MKTVAIDLEALTEYLISECPLLRISMEKTRHCRRKMENVCGIPEYMQDDCPEDCPRRYMTSTRCDGGQCGRIKRKIKELKAK